MPTPFTIRSLVFIGVAATRTTVLGGECDNTGVATTSRPPSLVAASVTVPQKSPSPAGFAPPGWKLIVTAEGDLNHDGRPDAAMVFAKDEAKDEDNDTPRLLVIALRDANKQLNRSACSLQSIMPLHRGGVMGDPFASLSITDGTVVISHSGGSRELWDYAHTFGYTNGEWPLIRRINAVNDRLTGASKTRDQNLVSGMVEETIEKGQGKPSARRAYYEVQAGMVDRPPLIDGRISPGEWPGLTVVVSDKGFQTDSTRRQSTSAEPAKLAATIGAVTTTNNLYLSVEVTGPYSGKETKVNLVRKPRVVIPPVEFRTSTDAGKKFTFEARYPLSALGTDDVRSCYRRLGLDNDLSISPDRMLPLTVEVKSGKDSVVLSTSCGLYPAVVRLTPTPGPIFLRNFDINKVEVPDCSGL